MKENIIIIIRSSKKKIWIFIIRPSLMEVSGSPQDSLGRGWFFCAKSPTLGDKLLSNFPRGKGGAIGRGSFHAKVLVLFIKNGRLPLQLIKKNTVEMQEDFLRKFCSYVCYLCLLLTDISGSLKILDNISVILSTKVRKNTDTSLSFSSPTNPWCSKRLDNLITK